MARNLKQEAREALTAIANDIRPQSSDWADQIMAVVEGPLAKIPQAPRKRQMPHTTKDHVIAVKKMLDQGIGQTTIAHEVGISVGIVGYIKSGKYDHLLNA